MQTTKRGAFAMIVLPTIKAFFDEHTNTISYLVADPATKRAAIVDPVLD
jgi:glyoxylase-like metal-dependent hydrolase (beta-lactamase superfamily II)